MLLRRVCLKIGVAKTADDTCDLEMIASTTGPADNARAQLAHFASEQRLCNHDVTFWDGWQLIGSKRSRKAGTIKHMLVAGVC